MERICKMTGKKIIFSKPEQKDIEKRIDTWVETGKIQPEKKDDEEQYRLSLDLPKFLHRRIKKICALEGISMKKKLTKVLLEAFPEN